MYHTGRVTARADPAKPAAADAPCTCAGYRLGSGEHAVVSGVGGGDLMGVQLGATRAQRAEENECIEAF